MCCGDWDECVAGTGMNVLRGRGVMRCGDGEYCVARREGGKEGRKEGVGKRVNG